MYTTSDYVKILSIEDLDGEIWKTIKEFPYYQVSNLGRVNYTSTKDECASGGRCLLQPERLPPVFV